MKRLECREGQENSNGEDSCDSNGGNEWEFSLIEILTEMYIIKIRSCSVARDNRIFLLQKF